MNLCSLQAKRSTGVLVSEDDWRSIQETLFLLSSPEMHSSIRRGLKTPITSCRKSLDWM